ncbi:winged helix-turn-helix domain-containing protein [Exilibacterium tricleocarpae]|nr:winged helix-turn-helix domain-containing protein [Exilibacterium tricleocarpae]
MIFEFSTWVLNTHRYELCHCGRPIKIRRKVFKVLSYLLLHRHRNVSRKELLEQVWSRQYVTEESVTSCIKEARQILGDTERHKRMIETIHGFGYRFTHPVTVQESETAQGGDGLPTPSLAVSPPAPDSTATTSNQTLKLSATVDNGTVALSSRSGALVENVVCRVGDNQTTWLLSGSCNNEGKAPPGLTPILDAIRRLSSGGAPIRLDIHWE